jgi:hypothetical protein
MSQWTAVHVRSGHWVGLLFVALSESIRAVLKVFLKISASYHQKKMIPLQLNFAGHCQSHLAVAEYDRPSMGKKFMSHQTFGR